MKKILGALALAAGAATASAATVNLTETFQSGATFTGVLTFSNNYDQLQAVTGTLSGGGYGSVGFGWAWWLGTGQQSIAHDYDGNPATYEDILMSGTAPGWQDFIGISWSSPGGVFQLDIDPGVDGYWRSINGGQDLAVSASTSAVPESGTLAMMLAGLGALGALARRKGQA